MIISVIRNILMLDFIIFKSMTGFNHHLLFLNRIKKHLAIVFVSKGEK